MNYLYAILAGFIQGLTEFLPVSSSGHLVLFHDLLKFNLPDDLAFDVVLHVGTLVALVGFFYKDIIKYLKAFVFSFFNFDLKNDVDQRLAWFFLIGSMPAAIVGFYWETPIELYFRNAVLVSICLIVVGLLLYYADTKGKKNSELNQLSFKSALYIGLAQSLALVPGVSRSGITIIAGLSQRLNRQAAARFSFLLAIPIVFAAGVKKFFDLLASTQPLTGQTGLLIAGFLTSVVTGYFCIKYFLDFLQNHSLKFFAYYRIILGGLIISLILLNGF